ncbi:MAG: bifunctional methylenetetrahydrofolate dehydrogenase/methenyltetrahydrofolate cyclohydrolase, partial [Erythrobacter sp.]|nr:bifunctional methylenetetrahydrofolate dehydrogenase/methenyltetrahydrofolate cyclohydrolase [Erythrobacter sp.]
MTEAARIDGKAFAETLRARIGAAAADFAHAVAR